MSRDDFNPNFVSNHVAPACGMTGAVDFPWHEVDAEEASRQDNDMTQADLNEALRMLLEWMVSVKAKDNRGLSPIATRTLACVWVIHPALLGNCAGHMVAKAYGISYQKFSENAAEFSRRFGIKNQFQAHDSKNKPT